MNKINIYFFSSEGKHPVWKDFKLSVDRIFKKEKINIYRSTWNDTYLTEFVKLIELIFQPIGRSDVGR